MEQNHIDLSQETPLMPVLFIGHGTPMNAIEENEFTLEWKRVSLSIPRPKAILCISAHWERPRTAVSAVKRPKTLHDFGGVPRQLFLQEYPVDGSPVLANMIYSHVSKFNIGKDPEWGLDHGTWSILKHMYPEGDIPALQLSIDYTKDLHYHYEMAKELRFLRQRGVLVIGSGNMIHNLRMACVGDKGFNTEYGYDWALELNDALKAKILKGDHEALLRYRKLSKGAAWGVPSEEHYVPLMCALALQMKGDEIELFNDKVVAGSVSMTSFVMR